MRELGMECGWTDFVCGLYRQQDQSVGGDGEAIDG